MTSVFDHPWLSGLFGDPEVSALWSHEQQLEHYRGFECALALALAAVGHVPEGQGHEAADIIRNATLDIEDLEQGTGRDGLPIPAMVRQFRKAAGWAEGAVHTGATSQDVLDTALALTLRKVTDLFLARLEALGSALQALNEAQGANALMGRTRMQDALPITVADRVRTWSEPLQAQAHALTTLRPMVERLQLGGAVGTGAAFGAELDAVRQEMSASLSLHDGPVWHTDRSGIADYAGKLSLVSGTLGKLGQDIALMAQQGVDDVSLKAGGGSSAMPHKSNPVLAELLVTLARFNATQLAGMHHALVHEQERSGSAWMLEWMILPPMTMATGRGLVVAHDLVGQIERLGHPHR